MPNPNLALLETSAQKLAPLLGEIVFVGGCATGLLINDPGAAAVRKTYDVDIIAEIASYAEYGIFSERLRLLDFTEDSSEGAPLCRWKFQDLILDVMPLDPAILGFSNRWYEGALRTSRQAILSKDITIRVITAPYFLGTKLEAFRGRGKEDFFASHDLEDFVAVIDGRSTILKEIADSPSDVREYLVEAAASLLGESRFLDAVPGFVIDSGRVPLILERLHQLAQLNA